MNPFRDDPYWQQYWRNKYQSVAARCYAYVPFLETASILMRHAAPLWHHWSRRRTQEVCNEALILSDRAVEIRGNGLYLYPGAQRFYRYHSQKPLIEHSETARLLLTTAIQLLFLLYPEVEKLGAEDSRVQGLTRTLETTLETLVESPFFDADLAVPKEPLSILVEYGALLECEGIAYSMAQIEDSFTRRMDRVVRNQQPRRPPDAELYKLAATLNVPFEELVSLFKEEHSAWWETSRKYREQAQGVAEEFLGMCPLPDEVLGVLRPWESGRPTIHGSSSDMYVDSERYAQGFLSAKTCIELFLTYKRSSRSVVSPEAGLISETVGPKLA